jgi:hypothetical protein
MKTGRIGDSILRDFLDGDPPAVAEAMAGQAGFSELIK